MKTSIKVIYLATFFTGILILCSSLVSSKARISDKQNSIEVMSTNTALSGNDKGGDTSMNDSQMTLKLNMSKLWEDHITWTRNVILCIVDSLPGADQAVKRLLQNQTDIGNAIKPYYGEAAGKKLTELLAMYINTSADVVNSAKNSNITRLNEANKKWFENADDISAFLCKANPIWALADVKKMMNQHLNLITNEVVERINKNYDAEIMAYDKVHDEILIISDVIAEGIIMQFPDKFKRGKLNYKR